MNIEEYLLGGSLEQVKTLEPNPFETQDALMEAALIDLRVNYFLARAWVLFSMPFPLCYDDGDVGFLVVNGLDQLAVEEQPPACKRERTVLGWNPEFTGGHFTLSAVYTGGRINLRGETAEFHTGDSQEGQLAPPDLTVSTDAEIIRGMPSWTSVFSPRSYAVWPM